LAHYPSAEALDRLAVHRIHYSIIHLSDMDPVAVVALRENINQEANVEIIYEDMQTLLVHSPPPENKTEYLEVCNRALVEDPMWLFALEQRMITRKDLGDRAGFASDQKRMVETKSLVLSQQAAEKFWQENFQRAITLANRSLEFNLENADAWTYLGLGYRKLGQATEAMDALNEAIRLNPEDWLAWSGRAKIWKNRGNTIHYERDIRRAEVLKP
jgi:tetratricopeptide (TPR) repeat protein